MSAHVADASQEAPLSKIAKDVGAEIAFRMANRIFAVKALDDGDSPDVIRAGLAAAARRHGYHSVAVKVGSGHADADSSRG
jgi:hypothetical protein